MDGMLKFHPIICMCVPYFARTPSLALTCLTSFGVSPRSHTHLNRCADRHTWSPKRWCHDLYFFHSRQMPTSNVWPIAITPLAWIWLREFEQPQPCFHQVVVQSSHGLEQPTSIQLGVSTAVCVGQMAIVLTAMSIAAWHYTVNGTMGDVQCTWNIFTVLALFSIFYHDILFQLLRHSKDTQQVIMTGIFTMVISDRPGQA